jgi:hypothetical protein
VFPIIFHPPIEPSVASIFPLIIAPVARKTPSQPTVNSFVVALLLTLIGYVVFDDDIDTVPSPPL